MYTNGLCSAYIPNSAAYSETLIGSIMMIRKLKVWCLSPLSLIIVEIFLASYPSYYFYYCEASTVPTTRTAGWNQRQEFQQRLISRAQIASDTIRRKRNKNDRDDGDGDDEITEDPIGLTGYKTDYNTLIPQEEIKYGFGHSFIFQRFQSPASIRKALVSVRSASSFKWVEGKDGRKGHVSSTKLGGDYVLAESEQIAVDCTTEDVLRVYLSGELQARWNAKNILECYFTKCKKTKNDSSLLDDNHRLPIKPRGRKLWDRRSNDYTDEKKRQLVQQQETDNEVVGDNSYFYRQDLLLKSQRVIRSHTGPMKYQQIIEIDKVGQNNYSILVRLFKNNKNGKNPNNGQHQLQQQQEELNSPITATAKKPFESLQVYVGLEQIGSDVKIYAAGVFEVNREVVPKIIVFDTSGFAGSIAGKGTLWLSGYFANASENRRKITE
jgi:hypothetical protein